MLINFSVKKTDKAAVNIARKVWDIIPDDGVTQDNTDLFVANLSDILDTNSMRCSSMLSWLGPIRKDKEDAIRIAYAALGYLPCFDKTDTRLETKYIGDPVFPVPGRFIAVKVFKAAPDKQPVVYVAFLALGTILAGRLCIMMLNVVQASKLLRKVYAGRSKADAEINVMELSGCYATIPSDWLCMRAGNITDVSLTAEMRVLNKALKNRRANKKCSVSSSCAYCYKGRDTCAIAVRRKTKQKESADGNVSESTTVSDTEGSDKRE